MSHEPTLADLVQQALRGSRSTPTPILGLRVPSRPAELYEYEVPVMLTKTYTGSISVAATDEYDATQSVEEMSIDEIEDACALDTSEVSVGAGYGDTVVNQTEIDDWNDKYEAHYDEEGCACCDECGDDLAHPHQIRSATNYCCDTCYTPDDDEDTE